MKWITWKATRDSVSPVCQTDEVCVRFHNETRETAIKRGFEKDCDTLLWRSGLGDGTIVEYCIKD